jgi:hypothetical protein
MKRSTAVVMMLALGTSSLAAQESDRRWERRSSPAEVPVTVFHSPQSANLPTAEMLRGGEWLFEISHRFLPAVSDGADALWGFDGPVYNRLGLAYAPSDRLLIGVVRSSLHDNLDLSVKARIAQGGGGGLPWMLAAVGGVAWNTEAPFGADDNEAQAYGQVIVNVLLGERFALGLVPSVLYNPTIAFVPKETDFALGLNGQLYVSDQVSFLAEWIVSPTHPVDPAELENDSGSFGIELETGGHFFKILLTNQVRMNPAQHLAGSPFSFEADEWRVGFNITRLLSF